MELELSDQYYLKAAGNYEYDIELALEDLRYALSYDPEHAPSHCLTGRICGIHLMAHTKAFHHMELALLYDPEYPETYYVYPYLLMQRGEFAKADRLLAMGIQQAGVDKSTVLILSAMSHEIKGNLYWARRSLSRALLLTTACDRMTYIDNAIKRIKYKSKRIHKL